MKKIEYTCNMCREIKKKESLMCMFYDSHQMWDMTADLSRSDVHVCEDCMKLISKYVNQIK